MAAEVDLAAPGPPPPPVAPVAAGHASAIELDFDARSYTPIEPAAARAAMTAGRFVWLDVDSTHASEARAQIAALGVLSEQVVDELFSGDPGTQVARYDDYLHMMVACCRLDDDGALQLERLDAVIGPNFFLTVHAGDRPVVDAMRRECRGDFLRFAKTPSFLVYELWDHLTEHYVKVQKRLEVRVEHLQAALFRDVDDAVFLRVAEVGASLLQFRSVLLPARTVLAELATRRSLFISEATQGFLGNMAGTIERVLQDLLVDRDSLTQSLHLHMSLITHRTNRAMNKLTVLSTIFLPLSFVCGVYGMNFEVLPELHWHYGYLFFWVLTITVATTVLLAARRTRLL